MSVRHVGLTLGIGVDILNTSRFERLLLKHKLNSSYVNKLSSRIFHPTHELPRFERLRRGDGELAKCVSMLSGSWAAKEAVFKTLDPCDQATFQFKEWYRFYSDRGKPFIRNDEYAQNDDEEFMLSISHDDNMLVAFVTRQKLIA